MYGEPGRRSAYVALSFDLFNVRDLDLIAQARTRCDRLVVGVLSDHDVAEQFGRPPVVPLSERLAIASHVRGVDQAIVHDAEVRFRDCLVLTVSSAESGDPTTLTIRRTSRSAAIEAALSSTAAEEVA